MKRVKPLFFLSISLFFISSVYATTSYLYNSNEIGYDNSKSKLTKTNLKEAVEELYTKCSSAPTKCPDGYTCYPPICKRVTESSSLNTETCQQSSNYCAAVEGNGNTITYGKAKELGTPLEPGDAFDCKVSTSGGYTERFYYVSDYYDTSTKSFNSDVGVLIYYSNTVNGSASNSGAAYDSNNKNYNGPVTAVTHMPTTTQWSNISLYKTNRQILAENNATSTSGGTLPTAFSYSGKAARLLTYQEVNQACYNTTTAITSTGGLNNCNFLFENTKYSSSSLATSGPWLETPYSSTAYSVYSAYSYYRSVGHSSAYNTTYGARPAIEIEKSSIDKTVRKVGIFYLSNGGTGTMNPKYINPNTTTTLDSNTYTRSGYIFDGWNTKADGSGTSYSNGGTIVPTTGVLKLYAQWRRVRASELYYDNTNTGMNCETAQCAIDYLKMKLYRKTNGLVE